MRVLFFSELYWPVIGGAEVLSAQLINELSQRNHEFMVITNLVEEGLSDEALYEGVPIHRFRFRQALSGGQVEEIARLRTRFERLKKMFRPELIHINSVGPSAFFHLTSLSQPRPPVLVTMQQNILPHDDTSTGSILGRTLREADWVSCVSDELLEQVRERIPETIPRSSTIYNTLQAPEDEPLELPFDAPRLLCLGRLVPQKGFDVALRAWAAVREKFPQAKLIVAGDGASRHELEELVSALHLTGSVEFLGWIPPNGVVGLINQATFVLMPSRREGLPLVGVQAAALGRPIIGSRTTGLTEVIEDRVTGVIVEPEDVDALARAIVRLLDEPGRTKEMGAAARRRALKLFDWKRTVDKYDSLYNKLGAVTAHGKAHLRPSQ